MTLGERCDEIVRLIDETLESIPAPNADLGGGSEPATAERLTRCHDRVVRESATRRLAATA